MTRNAAAMHLIVSDDNREFHTLCSGEARIVTTNPATVTCTDCRSAMKGKVESLEDVIFLLERKIQEAESLLEIEAFNGGGLFGSPTASKQQAYKDLLEEIRA